MLAAIKKNFIFAGILAIPEHLLPLKLRQYKKTVHRVHIALMLATMFVYILSMVEYLCFEAKAFADYSEISIFLSSFLLLTIFYVSFVCNASKMSAMLEDLESIIQESE